MLLIKQINSHIVLGILDLKLFSSHHPQSKHRELERKGSAYLIKEMLKDKGAQIIYSKDGKPYLENREELISISHSHDKLAVIINTKENCGIDIELVREKVQLIQHKFLNEKERQDANKDTERLVRYWAAKETLYKIYGLKGLDFIRHLGVEDFEDYKIIGKITINDYQKTYLLHWEKVDDYILMYSLNEI